jgi:hypothetical protein
MHPMANNRVIIKLDANNNLIVGDGIKRNQDQVVWENQTGQNGLTIDFGGTGPFSTNPIGPIDYKGKQSSGKATKPGTFKYTVKLAGHTDLDPNVIVDN